MGKAVCVLTRASSSLYSYACGSRTTNSRICVGEPPSINIRMSRRCASSRRDASRLTALQPAVCRRPTCRRTTCSAVHLRCSPLLGSRLEPIIAYDTDDTDEDDNNDDNEEDEMMLMLILLLMQVLMMMPVLTLMALITMTVRFLFLRWMEWAVTLSARSGLSVLRNLSLSLSLSHRHLAELVHQWHVAGRKKLRCNCSCLFRMTPPANSAMSVVLSTC